MRIYLLISLTDWWGFELVLPEPSLGYLDVRCVPWVLYAAIR